MSEQQKLFASLSGALVAHLIFFLLVFGFLSTRSANSSSARGNDRSAEAKSREITVLISDLMERVKVEPAPLVPPSPLRVSLSLPISMHPKPQPRPRRGSSPIVTPPPRAPLAPTKLSRRKTDQPSPGKVHSSDSPSRTGISPRAISPPHPLPSPPSWPPLPVPSAPPLLRRQPPPPDYTEPTTRTSLVFPSTRSILPPIA